MTPWEREQEDLAQLEYILKWKEAQKRKKQNKKSWRERIRKILLQMERSRYS